MRLSIPMYQFCTRNRCNHPDPDSMDLGLSFAIKSELSPGPKVLSIIQNDHIHQFSTLDIHFTYHPVQPASKYCIWLRIRHTRRQFTSDSASDLGPSFRPCRRSPNLTPHKEIAPVDKTDSHHRSEVTWEAQSERRSSHYPKLNSYKVSSVNVYAVHFRPTLRRTSKLSIFCSWRNRENRKSTKSRLKKYDIVYQSFDYFEHQFHLQGLLMHSLINWNREVDKKQLETVRGPLQSYKD
jgi:hypothetical protein